VTVPDWEPKPAKGLIEHQHRMHYDAAYKAMMEGQRQVRQIKREFLERIRQSVDGPMSEYLYETFGDEVEEPTYDRFW
jgi:hypothetical protein